MTTAVRSDNRRLRARFAMQEGLEHRLFDAAQRERLERHLDLRADAGDVEVLVTGWGHVARALAPRLAALGAGVCVCARSPGARAWIAAEGLEALGLPELQDALPGCGIVINTVPAPMLTAARVAGMKPDALILDLASAPGGTDFEAARAFGIRALTAPGLPGKWSPQTAAEAVRDAVYNILEDEKA